MGNYIFREESNFPRCPGMYTHFIYFVLFLKFLKIRNEVDVYPPQIIAPCIVKTVDEIDVYPPQTIAPCIVKIMN